MRVVSLEYPEDEEEQQSAAVASAPPRPSSAAGARVRAGWRAVPTLVRVMFVLDLLMGALYFFSRRMRDHIPKPLLNFLDLNGETNLPSWYSAAQLALIGALLATFAATQLKRGARAAWAVMIAGVGFLFLSLDETTSLHEHFGYWLDKMQHRRNTIFAETGFWMFVCAPVFLAVGVMLGFGARRYLQGRRSVMIKFIAGVAIYVAAAAGVEALSNFATPHGTAARVLVLLEEVGEMMGATMMLWAAYELIRSHGLRLMVEGSPTEQNI